MNQRNLISVIMPLYNCADFVAKAVDSILNQTYPTFELIIIDDGSSDNSLEVVGQFKDSRIKFYQNNSNKGLVYTLNRGLNIAKGDLVARMDADDMCSYQRFEKQLSLMERYPHSIVCGTGIQLFDDRNIRRKATRLPTNNLMSLLDCIVCHASTIVKKATFEKNNISYKYDSVIEDFTLWSEIYKVNEYRSNTFINVQEPLYYYRQHASQLTQVKAKAIENEGIILRRNILIEFFDYYEIGFKICNENSLNIDDFHRIIDIKPKVFKSCNYRKEDISQFLDKLLFYMIISLEKEEVSYKILFKYFTQSKVDLPFYTKVLLRKIFKRNYRGRF